MTDHPVLDHIGSFNFGRSRGSASWRQKLIFRLIPAYLWVQVRFEIRAFRVRLGHKRVERKVRDADGILLNLGSGVLGRPGWVNLDIAPGDLEGYYQYDCRKSLPFRDGTVNGIFSEHFFEHLDYTEELPLLLAECMRVMAPGSVIRIIVPDGEKYLKAYNDPGWDSLRTLRELRQDGSDKYFKNRYQTKIELVNTVFRQGYQHKWIYDFENLKWLLESAGFTHVKREAIGHSRNPDLAIGREDRAHESLYVEATKPLGA